jgi:hypothetical protein
MKLGLFYQSSHRYISPFYILEQFRKFYPTEPIAIYEDNSDVLKPVSDYFNCSYSQITEPYENYEKRPYQCRGACVDKNSMLLWFDRVYEACTTTLKETDWIIHMEDDVWFLRKLEGIPPYDLNSIAGRGWHEELYQQLETNVRGSYGCGGAVFNRLKFIESYHKLKNVDWEAVDKLAIDPKPTEWADIALTFAFLNNKSLVGYWKEIVNYRIHNQHHHTTREAYDQETLTKYSDYAIVHSWKPYYFPTQQEVEYVDQKINKGNK